MSKFRTRLGICILRGVRQVCWSPLWQSMSNVIHRWSGENYLPVMRRVGIVIKQVLLVRYLTVIKHVNERASFCNISNAGLATDREVMSPNDAYIYF